MKNCLHSKYAFNVKFKYFLFFIGVAFHGLVGRANSCHLSLIDSEFQRFIKANGPIRNHFFVYPNNRQGLEVQIEGETYSLKITEREASSIRKKVLVPQETLLTSEVESQLAGSHDLKSLGIRIHDQRMDRLVVHFGLRDRMGIIGEPSVTEGFASELHVAEELESSRAISMEQRRHIQNRSEWKSIFQMARINKVIIPVLARDPEEAHLSLEVVRRHPNGYRESIGFLVFDPKMGFLPEGWSYDFRGAVLGTGQDGVNGRILVSPRLVLENDHHLAPRQILIFNSRLELLDLVPISAEKGLKNISYLTMDGRYIYMSGITFSGTRALQIVSRDDLDSVASFEVDPSEASDRIGLVMKSLFQSNFQIIGGVAQGEFIAWDGKYIHYELNLNPLLAALK